MARRRILARLWELIGPPRVTRAEAVAIAMAEFERIGRGPGERLSISRWLGTWTVVINPPNVRGGRAAVDIDCHTGEVRGVGCAHR